MKHLLSLALLLCAFAAIAQQSIINNLTNSTVIAATTNIGVGGGSLIGWNIDKVGVVQFTVVGTNANLSANVVLTFETSDNGTDWVTGLYPVIVDANGTTAATQISRITNSTGGKYLRPYSLLNSNASAATISRLTLSLKE